MSKFTGNKKKLLAKDQESLINIIQSRFEKNSNRHKGITWAAVLAKLESNAGKLWSLNEMERTGGEPDVIGYDKNRDEYFFSTVRPKAQRKEEVFVMMQKRWHPEKNSNQQIVP